jgi:hypothetical protein
MGIIETKGNKKAWPCCGRRQLWSVWTDRGPRGGRRTEADGREREKSVEWERSGPRAILAIWLPSLTSRRAVIGGKQLADAGALLYLACGGGEVGKQASIFQGAAQQPCVFVTDQAGQPSCCHPAKQRGGSGFPESHRLQAQRYHARRRLRGWARRCRRSWRGTNSAPAVMVPVKLNLFLPRRTRFSTSAADSERRANGYKIDALS